MRVKTSKYKYVKRIGRAGNIYYKCAITVNLKDPFQRILEWGCYKTEKEAAIAVDKYLIQHGKAPVNILKPKLTNQLK